jgi:hypothetical protein
MMAERPEPELIYREGCGDCGVRQVELPAPLPAIGDDFDWDVRDYDGFRLFMLEELAARFPERRNWTPADMEVVLVEALAVVLDQMADMQDRIQTEAYLETARRPASVRRLLSMIGYDPLLRTDQASTHAELEQLWRYYPHLMDEAKREGPESIQQQHRIVTTADYRTQLSPHPLVLDADAYSAWSGAWHTHQLVLRLINNLALDEVLDQAKIVADAQDPEAAMLRFEAAMVAYYTDQAIPVGQMPPLLGNTPRTILRQVVERQRMVGQEVLLRDANLVGIRLALSIRIAGDYYRSEIQDAVRAALLDTTDGFFAPGNLAFGEDLVASDLVEILMALEGIQSVCINRMQRVGAQYSDQSGTGRIVLQGHEVAVLEDDISQPERGALRMLLHGGKSG